MRLTSLEIENYRVIRQTQLTFPDHVIGIIGPNGAGKSSLNEAVAWALYGNNAARTGRDEIKSASAAPSDLCRVRLEFGMNGDSFVAERRLVGKTGRAEIELYRNGRSESVGVTETQDHIANLLGLDWRGFLTSFLARQQELNALSDLQPSRRRDHLAAMLGIERLDKAIQRVKEDTRSFRERIGFLERQTAVSDDIKRQLAVLTERLKAEESALKHADELLRDAKRAFDSAAAEWQDVQKVQQAWQQLAAQKSTHEATLSELKDRVGELESERAELLKIEKEAQSLRPQVEDYPEVKKLVEHLRERRSSHKISLELQSQRRDLEAEIKRQETQLAGAKEEIDKVNIALKSIPDQIEKSVETLDQKIEAAREEYSEKSAVVKSLQSEIDKLSKQLLDVSSFGPESVCDRCHRPLGDDLPRIESHLKSEKHALAGRLNQAQEHLDEIKKRGAQLRSELQQAREKLKNKHELDLRLKSGENRIADVSRSISDLRKRLESISARLKGHADTVFDQKELMAAEKRMAEIEDQRGRISELQGRLQRLPEVKKQIASVSAVAKKGQSALDDVMSRIADLKYDERAYEKNRIQYEKAREAYDVAKEARSEIAHKSALTRRDLEARREQHKSLEEGLKELERGRTDVYYGEKLANLFAQFRKDLIASIRPTLADASSELISEMTNGKYNLVELDENYNLSIFDAGEFFGIERFSGGEKDLANLCLRMAISQALTESAGLDRSFVILDEVFGSQDDERRELIVDALKNLRRSFPQIFLVTHIEDLKHRVEDLIEIRPTDAGYSEVIFNGTVT